MSDQWTTAVGVFADEVGAIEHITDEVNRTVDRAGHERVSITRYRQLLREPASKYAASQPSTIPARWRHRDEIGRVILLSRSRGRFGCVAVLAGPVEQYTDMVEMFWSSGTRTRADGDLELTEISLTPTPATSALAPVTFWSGLPNEAKGLHAAPWALLNRASEVMRGANDDPLQAPCRFDDDTPRRPVGESRGQVMRNGEPMEMLYRPATIVAVGGRPPRGMR